MNLLYQLIGENKVYLYYAVNDGTVIRKHKLTKIITPCCMYLRKATGKRVYPYMMVKYCNRDTQLSTLIAKSFVRGFDSKKQFIDFKDGNCRNCSVDNLVIKSRSNIPSLSKATQMQSKPVVVIKDGQKIIYKSIRAAARHMYISYQTIIDYLKGYTKNPYVIPCDVKIYYYGGKVK